MEAYSARMVEKKDCQADRVSGLAPRHELRLDMSLMLTNIDILLYMPFKQTS